MAKLKEKLRRLDWGNHLLNFLGTCLGVLLALYLSNYQQHRRDHQRLDIAMENIIAEIQENYNKTKKHLYKANHQLVVMDAYSY